MDDVVAGHARNLKRDRLLSEKERERLMNRKDKSKLAINDARVRKKLSNWLKTLDEVFLIFNNLPEVQSRNVITKENAFELLCLAARAMKIKEFYPVDGIVNDPFTWETDFDRCQPLNFEKFNSALYRAKFGTFIAPSLGGESKLDMQMLSILQTGVAMDIDSLVKGLRIDPSDSEAVAAVKTQIKHLQAVGLVEETSNGWQWVNPKDSKKEKS